MIRRVALVVLGLLVVAVGIWYFFFASPATVGVTHLAPDQNPFGQPAGNSSQGNSGATSSTTAVTVLETKYGQTVSVPADLTTGKITFPVGTHQFYFLTNNQQTEGARAQFDILYGTDSSISIGLFNEPLGQARLAAEAELRTLLSLSDSQLCSLRVTVEVPDQVNDFYAGKNLGLSFCPGATELPQ